MIKIPTETALNMLNTEWLSRYSHENNLVILKAGKYLSLDYYIIVQGQANC